MCAWIGNGRLAASPSRSISFWAPSIDPCARSGTDAGSVRRSAGSRREAAAAHRPVGRGCRACRHATQPACQSVPAHDRVPLRHQRIAFISMAAWDRCVDPDLTPCPFQKSHPAWGSRRSFELCSLRLHSVSPFTLEENGPATSIWAKMNSLLRRDNEGPQCWMPSGNSLERNT